MADPTRELAFEGCFNFRDLGGYIAPGGRRIRWRHLFRSDSLSRLTDDDRNRMERDLGIRTVLDLRTTAMHNEFPCGLSVTCVHLPLFSDEVEAQAGSAMDVSPRTWMLQTRGDADDAIIARVFALLAEESSYPVVFHCLVGKDRTGLIAALVLGALGVADDDIVVDYATTQHNMVRTIERLRKLGRLPADGSFTKEIPQSFFETPPSAMRELLRELRNRSGTVRNYVRSCGVDASKIDALERVLLTDATDA